MKKAKREKKSSVLHGKWEMGNGKCEMGEKSGAENEKEKASRWQRQE